MTHNQLVKLIAKGRVTPIIKAGEDGSHWLVGYERKPGSRKAHQKYWLPRSHKLSGK